MDATPLTSRSQSPGIALVRGEFAPVYWEPLGRRGERLVAGLLLAIQDKPAVARITLHDPRLLEFISSGKTESAGGVIRFAFDFFSKTLNAGGIISDLRAPFASMTIGRTEPISGRDDAEVWQRATRLCTLLGNLAEAAPKTDASHIAARTYGFLRDVRGLVRAVDKGLARMAMKHNQFFPIGNANMRVHFQHEGHYAQFCSLPLPNARTEIATECSARIMDLEMIRRTNPSAKVALCINNQAMDAAQHYQGKHNATLLVQARTIEYAKALGIETQSYHEPREAARFLRAMVGHA
jgi:hypothetical protein